MSKTSPRTRRSLRTRALVLALPLLAATGCDGAVSSSQKAGIGGTYTGASSSTSGTRSYRLVIPETGASPFGVTGTIVENGRAFDVRGTAVYEHPRVTFELVRAGEGAESVFGLSGDVDLARGAITVPGPAALTLVRD